MFLSQQGCILFYFFEKHQLLLSSTARKKWLICEQPRYVDSLTSVNTQGCKNVCGHLRHIGSCSLRAARGLRAILRTKSHQSGLVLSNEAVRLHKRFPDMNDEQESVSQTCFGRQVINEARGSRFTAEILKSSLSCL